MSQLTRIVRREIANRVEVVGTVLRQRELRNFEAAGSPVWACDVDVGSNRILVDVPIKGGSGGQRFFAELGTSVLLRREANGRFYVVGPADRSVAIATKKTYTLGTLTPDSTAQEGFQAVPVPFEFYEGTGPPSGSFWNDGVTPFPLTRILDAQGNPI